MYMIEQIIYNKKLLTKFNYIFLICLIVTIIYTFIPDIEFGGITEFQRLVEKKLIDIDTNEQFNNNKKILEKKEEEQKNAKFVNKEILNNSPFYKMFNRFYFSMITSFTIGYGDIYPNSIRVRFIVIIQLVLTFLIIMC